jgi:large subunit ribosomal protein L15
MGLESLKPAKGSIRSKYRVGRGPGSGNGVTAGRGEKGAKSRSGYSRRRGFEGGQMPLIRRLPKRGFTNIFREPFQVVNLKALASFDPDSAVDTAALAKAGLIHSAKRPVKILAEGDLDRPLRLKVDAVSATARQKIEAAGGSIELVGAGAKAQS